MEQKLQKLYEETIALRERLLSLADENSEVRALFHASDCLKQAAGFMDRVLNHSENNVSSKEKFNVYQFFADGSNEHVLSQVSVQEAIIKAYFLANSVGARIGTTKRVIITYSGDFTAWEWIYGKGFVFPLICSNSKCGANDVLADTPCKSCGTITVPKVLHQL